MEDVEVSCACDFMLFRLHRVRAKQYCESCDERWLQHAKGCQGKVKKLMNLLLTTQLSIIPFAPSQSAVVRSVQVVDDHECRELIKEADEDFAFAGSLCFYNLSVTCCA